ncbi:CocE/NonD family hydrolase [Enemella sp. A6]|uniref:CocE/NonD family hydrolase n=1 Tax=Enemella sp. A6 TaxID=3440152 RepID=UPI003EB9BE16
MTLRLVHPDELHHRTEVRHEWIEMPDGVKLHARIWLPVNAEHQPVPALLEYLPYRKSDWTAVRDAERHPWYAGHGYASVRVDIRGTGDSEGVFDDEYSEQELEDGLAVIAWLADQSWCTGKVGMFGISWGGFNSLQLAALRPPALKAIVTVCSTDDRFDNDVHYVGGSVLGIDMTAWAATMLAFSSRPPDPLQVGDRWREMWLERIEHLTPPLLNWLSHQTRDEYWRRGSVCEDYSAIEAAVLAVGGWADPYHDAVLRLVQNLPGPVRGILGPWAHHYPDRANRPGRAIGFLQETLRWWDHWLKDQPTGVLDDPKLRVFLEDSRPPEPAPGNVPGVWLATDWPAPEVAEVEYELPAASVPARDGWVIVDTPQHLGADSGKFFPYGNITDLPPDQRAEDGRGVSFTLHVAEEPLTVVGWPKVRLQLDSSTPRGQVIARLCDVGPDGSSRLISRGVLNLSTRHGRDRNDDFVPGSPEQVEIRMTGLGVRLAPGHALRLVLSSTYWPWVWPQADNGFLRVHLPSSSVELPVLDPGRVPSADETTWADPEQALQLEPVTFHQTRARGPQGLNMAEREVRHDVGAKRWTLLVDPAYGGSRTYPNGLVYDEEAFETYAITEDDPLSPLATSRWRVGLARGEWQVEVRTEQQVQCDADDFLVRAHVQAVVLSADGQSDAEVLAQRSWEERIPRNGG